MRKIVNNKICSGISGMICSGISLHFLYKYNYDVQEAQYEVHSDFRTQFSITERENEVIILLLKGYAYNKIAETLCISLSTVRTHVMNIYKKVGINSRYELYNKVY
jgi:DNA-binding NarL/FixJ family response regulator